MRLGSSVYCDRCKELIHGTPYTAEPDAPKFCAGCWSEVKALDERLRIIAEEAAELRAEDAAATAERLARPTLCPDCREDKPLEPCPSCRRKLCDNCCSDLDKPCKLCSLEGASKATGVKP